MLDSLTLTWCGRPAHDGWASFVAAVNLLAQSLNIRVVHAEVQQAEPDCLAFGIQASGMSEVRVTAASGIPGVVPSESILQAQCGIMSVHGRSGGGAQALGVPYVSALSAILALQGGLAALVSAQQGRPYREVWVSMLGAGLISIGQYLAGATAVEEGESILPGSSSPLLRPPFVSSDRVRFELETLSPEPWRQFWELIGLPGEVAGHAWRGFLMRYARAESPLPEACLQALAQLPYAHICSLAEAAGVAVIPLKNWREAGGGTLAPKLWQVQQGPVAPALRQTDEDAALPLAGIRVMESCRRIQGPLAGHLLSLAGAKVLRLEPPGGDPLRAMPPCVNGCSVRFDAISACKQVTEVDIRTAEGRAAIAASLPETDVFLQNWAPGKDQTLELDFDMMKSRQPGLVYAYAGGWGSEQTDLPGTDFVVQAWSGVASVIAERSGERGGSLFTVLDVLGGAMATLGVTAGLLRRALDLRGVRVESSLLGGAELLLHLVRNYPVQAEFEAIVPTEQGLLAIECTTAREYGALCDRLDVEHCSKSELRALLPEKLSRMSALDWELRMRAARIPAAAVIEHLEQLCCRDTTAPYLIRHDYAAVQSPWRFI
ncbi:CoA transferase [Marinobacterium marinum]|uniref:CoA transferase n=1 Tax=Marinobacterium marinum TaxID=2756129 RepID=A0A7W1WXZ7_9GAMM|nr:CoA transferase [Marinobacterium marinum]MBA4502307.1 CoA transferase [Marinobacterium marinum]